MLSQELHLCGIDSKVGGCLQVVSIAEHEGDSDIPLCKTMLANSC